MTALYCGENGCWRLFRKSAAPERGWESFGCLQYWFGEREEKDKSCDTAMLQHISPMQS